jgi:hypothetical protein
MYVLNAAINGCRKWTILVAAAAVLTWTHTVAAQEPSATGKDDLYIGPEFLRAVYPRLNGNGYTITIETALSYDKPGLPPNYFQLFVGARPDFEVSDCCVGGHMGGALSPPTFPWPLELGPPSSEPPAPPSPSTSPAGKQLTYLDSGGRRHPLQFLSARFSLDRGGSLVGYSADGPAINDGGADNKVYQLVHDHPNMSGAEVIAALKQYGVKYGPDDKEQFVKDLPVKQLEPFLGKLELLSVGFYPLEKSQAWGGEWTVEVLATGKGSTKSKYKLQFDPMRGDLIGLFMVPDPTK